MLVYGVDYFDGDDMCFAVVDASDYDEAYSKAVELLKEYSIPKRNIINIEEILEVK